jgi:hypothetical protein
MPYRDEEEKKTNKPKIIGICTAAFLGVAGTWWGLSSINSHNGTEFKLLMNKGVPQSVTTQGLLFAYGIFDRVFSLPMSRQITTIADQEINLRSKDGEEFVGGLRVEYQFNFGNDSAQQRTLIANLFRDFNITDTRVFWDTREVDPVERAIKARGQTAAVAAFAAIATDEFQGRMAEVAEDIQRRLQTLMDREGIPVRIMSIDTTGVSPSPAVQERINRIASERRESDRGQIVIDNASVLREAAAAEAVVLRAFTDPLRIAGYSEESIVALNCQRLADRADRFGIPFGANCQGGISSMPFAVTVNPNLMGQQPLPVSAAPAPAPAR